MEKKKKKKFQKGYKTQKYPKETNIGGIPKDKGENDLRWYNNLPDLMKSITIPNFLQNLGSVEVGDIGSSTSTDRVGLSPVAALNLKLMLGSDSQGGVKTAIRRLYTNLRRVNTGSTVYNTADLLHYVYNIRAAIALDRSLRRAYGCINKYNPLNNKQPFAIFTALGLDYDTFKDNKANIRLILNNNASRLHTLMAGKCDLFERTAWLFDHIFLDGETKKAQMYVLNAEEIPYWDYSSSTWKYINLPLLTNATTNTGRTWTAAATLFNSLMDNIYSEDKVSLISADIIKAYGTAQSDSYFDNIPEDYVTPVVYSKEVLAQIQNSVITGDTAGGITPTDSETLLINSGSMVSSIGASPVVEHYSTPYFNTYKDSIDVLELAEHTRFTVIGNSLDNSNRVITTTYGTEIVRTVMFAVPFKTNNLSIASAINPYGLARVIYSPLSVAFYGGDSTIGLSEVFRYLWSIFDWMPAFRRLATGYYPSGSTTYAYTEAGNFLSLDLDNFYKMKEVEVLDNINTVVVQSLLYWPDVIRDVKVAKL